MSTDLESPGRSTASSRAQKILKATSPWFRDLLRTDYAGDRRQRFMHDVGSVNGVQVQVIEFAGKARDVFLMHPWALHAPSANCSTNPRLMLMTAFYRYRSH